MNLIENFKQRTEIFDGKIIHVYRDEVILPNGKQGFREVAEHNGGVMVAPITDDDSLIFVKQFRYPFNRVLLEFPAGKLEKGEDSLSAGIRELKEEVGAAAKNVISIGEIYPTVAYCSEVIYLYIATGLEFGEQHLDEDEFVEIVKIPLEKAVEMVMKNEIKDSKTVAGILKINYLKTQGKI